MGFFSSLFKGEPRRCKTCQKADVQDTLAIEGGIESIDYCRNDLMREFERAFLAFKHPMVLCYPDYTSKYAWPMFPFYPVDELLELAFTQEAVDRTQEIITSISGKSCRECSATASVAYLASIPYDSGTGPLLEQLVMSDSTYLCSRHAFDKIRSVLANHPHDFFEGVFAPYHGPGIFVTTYL